jgi:hypothetical protein
VCGAMIAQDGADQCPLSLSLLGVKRTWLVATHMSAFDPKRTLGLNSFLVVVCYFALAAGLRNVTLWQF